MFNDVMNWLRLARIPSQAPRVHTPKGGTRLQAIFLDKVDFYLAGRTRDQRSYPLRDSKGTVHDPILSYRTFVNYSRFYRAARAGQRECRRRCHAFYLNPEGATTL